MGDMYKMNARTRILQKVEKELDKTTSVLFGSDAKIEFLRSIIYDLVNEFVTDEVELQRLEEYMNERARA